MAHVIAVAGKGGVGKTTLTGLLIQEMCKKDKTPILAVDADANANLNEVLGVETGITLGELREDLETTAEQKNPKVPSGMDKGTYVESKMHDILVEDDNFDLMVMGRSQGAGCYCYVNSLLQSLVKKLEQNYPFIIVDNEAGMEHISRGVLPNIDTLILISDCSRRGVQAAGRIAKLSEELKLQPKSMGLIINKAPHGQLDEGIYMEIEKQNLNLLGIIPADKIIYQYDCNGTPMTNLPENSSVRTALTSVLEKLNLL